MESIPPMFWMFIIFGLALGVFLILFYVAMAVRESIGLIRESTGVLKEVREITGEAKSIIVDVKSATSGIKSIIAKITGTVDLVNENIVAPILAIGGFLSTVSGVVTGKKSRKDKELLEI